MRNATPVLPFKTRRPTRRHYVLCVNFRPFLFFTRTTRAKINPVYNHQSLQLRNYGKTAKHAHIRNNKWLILKHVYLIENERSYKMWRSFALITPGREWCISKHTVPLSTVQTNVTFCAFCTSVRLRNSTATLWTTQLIMSNTIKAYIVRQVCVWATSRLMSRLGKFCFQQTQSDLA